MKLALRVGVSPREIHRVILEAHVYAGMPKMIRAMRIYPDLRRDLGKLDLTDPPFAGDALEGPWLGRLAGPRAARREASTMTVIGKPAIRGRPGRR